MQEFCLGRESAEGKRASIGRFQMGENCEPDYPRKAVFK